MYNPSFRNLLPSAGIMGHCLRQLVVLSTGSALEYRCGVRCGTAQGMRKSLVLVCDGGGRSRSGEVGALEVRGGEVGDTMPDGCS